MPISHSPAPRPARGPMARTPAHGTPYGSHAAGGWTSHANQTGLRRSLRCDSFLHEGTDGEREEWVLGCRKRTENSKRWWEVGGKGSLGKRGKDRTQVWRQQRKAPKGLSRLQFRLRELLPCKPSEKRKHDFPHRDPSTFGHGWQNQSCTCLCYHQWMFHESFEHSKFHS